MQPLIRTPLVAGGILAAALLATGCSVGGADFSDAETVSQTILYDGHALTIDAGNADLILASGGSGVVKIDRQIAGTANGDSPEASETLDGDTLDLSVDCNGFAIGCKGRYTVTVPDGVAVDAENKNSLITVDGFGADLAVSAVNGHADLARISSPVLTLNGKDMDVDGTGLSAKSVTTDTRNGDIDLAFSEAPDSVEVDSKDGDVTLTLPDTEYRVDVTSKKGDEDVTVSRSDSADHVISVNVRNGRVAIGPAS